MMTRGRSSREKNKRSLRAVIPAMLPLRQIGSAAFLAITCRRRRLTVGSFFRIVTRWALGNRLQAADVPYIVKTHRPCDRAAVLTTGILQIIETAPPQECRQAIEELVRDEFTDLERQVFADRGQADA
jgi:hypothetical protein